MSVFIGIDVGTSACRARAVDAAGTQIAAARSALPEPLRDGARVEQDPMLWWQALSETLDRLSGEIEGAAVQRIAIAATSATVLLCAPDGRPLSPALLYNDARAVREAEQIARLAPPHSAAVGPSSSLAKLLHLAAGRRADRFLALHQADWLTGRLTGRYGISDENNALKMGYDVERRQWPAWLQGLALPGGCLPRVVAPGSPIGPLEATLARRWNWPRDAQLVAGTTDSTAGFIATGALARATAVTALGSTLVLKVLAEHPVFDAASGVYSHRLGPHWLVGGASNAGGSVLRTWFTAEQIERLSEDIDPSRSSGLDYYPLPARGERFPVCDPYLQPRLAPRPASDMQFLHGLLEGLANIEVQGYRRLAELGAPYPERVLTVGGGAQNETWRRIRERLLQVPVSEARHQEASYGAALLARGV